MSLGGLVPIGVSAAERPAVIGRHAGIAWKPCFAAAGPDFECATVKVPLDYDRPRGRKIRLALVRLPAADPSARVGSLFVNPGGPGLSGVNFVVGSNEQLEFVYGPQVRASYDLVGLDPRGVWRSTPLQCFDTPEEALQGWPAPFPLSRRQVIDVVKADRGFTRACKEEAGPIGRHMSTANVARDLDLLRARVGDKRLNFVGLSYGSYLGVTYANLFPDRVGAVVVDGVPDPVAWVNKRARVPFSTRLRSDKGSQETLHKLFSLCDVAGPKQCALAPNSAERFEALAARLRTEPIAVIDSETGEEAFVIDYQRFIDLTLGELFDPFRYNGLVGFFALLEAQASPARIGNAYRRLAEASPSASLHRGSSDFPEESTNRIEGAIGVICTDSGNPRRYSAWWKAGVRAEARFGYFGRTWTWRSSVCARWPLADRDRYRGPFTATTANPVLVVGNLYDPSTPYEGAEAVRRLLPRSALLSVDMPGHTSLGLSACAGSRVGEYLLNPQAAAEIDGVTCPPEFNPFELFSARRAVGAGLSPEVRREFLEELAPLPIR